jgi:hypothetical protein
MVVSTKNVIQIDILIFEFFFHFQIVIFSMNNQKSKNIINVNILKVLSKKNHENQFVCIYAISLILNIWIFSNGEHYRIFSDVYVYYLKNYQMI